MAAETISARIELPAGAVLVQAAPPDLVSQKTSEAVLGIPRRTFLEALAAFRASGGAVANLGKLRLVDRAAFVAWLQRAGQPQEGEEQDGAVAMAHRLGLRVVGKL